MLPTSRVSFIFDILAAVVRIYTPLTNGVGITRFKLIGYDCSDRTDGNVFLASATGGVPPPDPPPSIKLVNVDVMTTSRM